MCLQIVGYPDAIRDHDMFILENAAREVEQNLDPWVACEVFDTKYGATWNLFHFPPREGPYEQADRGVHFYNCVESDGREYISRVSYLRIPVTRLTPGLTPDPAIRFHYDVNAGADAFVWIKVESSSTIAEASPRADSEFTSGSLLSLATSADFCRAIVARKTNDNTNEALRIATSFDAMEYAFMVLLLAITELPDTIQFPLSGRVIAVMTICHGEANMTCTQWELDTDNARWVKTGFTCTLHALPPAA